MKSITITMQDLTGYDYIQRRFDSGFGDGVLSLIVGDEVMAEDTTFHIEDDVAKEIKELCERDNYYWPVFSSDLSAKLINFCFSS